MIVRADAGEPDKLFRIVSGRVRGFHLIASDVIVNRRETGCDRMPPATALDRGKPLCGQCKCEAVHPQFRVDKNIQLILLNY